MDRLNWNDLHYFVYLVNQHTLSAAAEKLGVQHSTVARRVEKLEQALNIKLFNRMGKRYHLTEEGKLLYAQTCEVEESIDRLKRIANEQTALQGRVIISAPPVLAHTLLLPHLSKFYQRHPDICLCLQGDVHYSDLYKREADIALRLGRPSQDGLVIRKLTDVYYRLYVHQSVYHQYHLPLPQQQLAFIEFKANPKLFAWAKHIQQQVNARVVFSSNDFYMTKQAICLGIGMGFLPEFMVAQSDNLIVLNPVDWVVAGLSENNDVVTMPAYQTAELYLVMHSDVRRAARVRAVADWLIRMLIK